MASGKRLVKVLLVNCDNLVDLDVVKKHLFGRLPIQPNVEIIYFSVDEIQKSSEEIVARNGSDRPDCALFLVHAKESRLSINEAHAGIGYEKIYTALRQATDDNVIVGIVGDEHSTEENKVISRWAVNRIQAQFSKDYIQGPKGYVFSWNHYPTEEHTRVTHEFITAALPKLEEIQWSTDYQFTTTRKGSARGKNETAKQDTESQVLQQTKESNVIHSKKRTGLQPLKVIIAGFKSLNLNETKEGLFKGLKEWLDVHTLPFDKQNTEDISTKILQLGDQSPCLGIMIVDSQEPRLSLNEPQAGIGYTCIYQSLLSVTENKVIVILVKDRHYEVDQQCIISKAALFGIQSQFKEENLDGTDGYIFSWKECAQNIHREKLIDYVTSKNLITTDMYEKWVAQINKRCQREPVNVNTQELWNQDQNPLPQEKPSSSGNAEGSYYGMYADAKVVEKSYFSRTPKYISATDILKKRCSAKAITALKKYVSNLQERKHCEVVGIFAYLPDYKIDDEFSAFLIEQGIIRDKKCPDHLLKRLEAPKSWHDTIVVIERRGKEFDISYILVKDIESAAKDYSDCVVA